MAEVGIVSTRQPVAKSYVGSQPRPSLLSPKVELEPLLRLSSQLLATADVQQVLELGAREAGRLLQVNSCAAALNQQTNGNLVVRAGWGLAEQWVERVLDAGHTSLSGCAVSTKGPALLSDCQTEKHLHMSPLALEFGLRSGMAVPMLVDGQAIGVLVVYGRSPRRFSDDQVCVLSFIANQAAVALEVIQTLEQGRQQISLLEAAVYSAQRCTEPPQACQQPQSQHESSGKARAGAEAVRRKGLADSTSDGLFVIDKRGQQVAVNRAFCEMTGLARRELLGQGPPFPYWREEEAERPESTFQESARQREPASAEVTFKKKDGTCFPALVTFVPLRDQTGAVVGHIGIVRDLAEFNKAQAQLRQAARLASLGELVSGMAHELNNPLTVILALSELVQGDDKVGKRTRQDLAMIEKQAERSARLVHNVLKFARPHGKERTYVSINQLVHETLELMDSQLRVHEVELVLDLASDLPWTVVNPHQIQQVFVNVINNADQAMFEAHRRGSLAIMTRAVGRDTIRIAFTDDGPGIDEKIMAHVFEPFFTTKPLGMGTGLGLSVCREIVQEHGGRIWAESELGHGTTFFVELAKVDNGNSI